jgi:hypothetical protein
MQLSLFGGVEAPKVKPKAAKRIRKAARKSKLTRKHVKDNRKLFNNVINNWATQIDKGTPSSFDRDDAFQSLWLHVIKMFAYWDENKASIETALKTYCRQGSFQLVQKHGGKIRGTVDGRFLQMVSSKSIESYINKGF